MVTRKQQLTKELTKRHIPFITAGTQEPAFNTGANVSVVLAILYGIKYFFFPDMSPEQETALYGVLALVLPVITALLIRYKVWSPTSANQLYNEGVRTGREREKEERVQRIKSTIPTKFFDKTSSAEQLTDISTEPIQGRVEKESELPKE